MPFALALLFLFVFYLKNEIDILKTQLKIIEFEDNVFNKKETKNENHSFKSKDLEFFDKNDNLTALLNESSMSFRDTNKIVETRLMHTGVLFINDSIVPYHVSLTGKGILFIKKDLDNLELIDLVRWENLINFSDKNIKK